MVLTMNIIIIPKKIQKNPKKRPFLFESFIRTSSADTDYWVVMIYGYHIIIEVIRKSWSSLFKYKYAISLT